MVSKAASPKIKLAVVLLLLLLLLLGLFFSLPSFLGGRFLKPVNQYSPSAKALIDRAMNGLDSRCLVDVHLHLAGLGNSSSGIYVSPKGLSLAHPFQWLKTNVYMSASGVENKQHADEEYWARLQELINDFSGHLPAQTSWHGVLLGFDKFHDPQGLPVDEKTSLYIPNAYAYDLAQSHSMLHAAASIHPDRADAIEQLRYWHGKGVRLIKWLPNSMRIDPSSEQAMAFLKVMKELDMILLTHVGEERAVDGDEYQYLGNPLLYRPALNAGVKILMAHVASLGECHDLDNNKQKTSCFELFWRMFEKPEYENNLFGEISAVTLHTRLGTPIMKLLDAPQLHHRLVNGSDYPLPGVNWIFRTTQMVKLGFITEEERKDLNQIYRRNPLLFDFVTKRLIRHPVSGNGLSAQSFAWPQQLGGCELFKK